MILDMSQVSDKQDAFLRDDHRHVAYGGAARAGPCAPRPKYWPASIPALSC